MVCGLDCGDFLIGVIFVRDAFVGTVVCFLLHTLYSNKNMWNILNLLAKLVRHEEMCVASCEAANKCAVGCYWSPDPLLCDRKGLMGTVLKLTWLYNTSNTHTGTNKR